MKNTNELITNIIEAIIPIAQEYVNQQKAQVSNTTELSIVKDETVPTDFASKTFQKISRETRFKTNDMIKMVNLKIKGKSQTEIANECNTSQSRVSLYLTKFKEHYKTVVTKENNKKTA